MIFDGTGDAVFFGIGQAGITQGCEDALTRLTFRVAERFDELDDGSALDGFGAEIHAGENRGVADAESRNKYIIRHYKTTSEITNTYYQWVMISKSLEFAEKSEFSGEKPQKFEKRKKLGLWRRLRSR